MWAPYEIDRYRKELKYFSKNTMESNAQLICSDIDTQFNQDISLHRLIVREQIKKTLLTWLDFYYELSDINRKIRAIMVCGQTSTTIARALANSFGNTTFKCCEGAYLGNGVCHSDFFIDGDDLTTFYVHRVELCNRWVLPELSRITRDYTVRVPEKIGIQKEQFHPFNRLLIFSTYDLTLCDDNLVDSMDLVIEIENYSEQETKAILIQRLQYMKWKVQDIKLIDVIASISNGSIKRAVNILRWSYRCCRANGGEQLKMSHLNQALHILR
jgi:Holliday junction resolvasome RuvABC ATP-dependent DNA helicase subunit